MDVHGEGAIRLSSQARWLPVVLVPLLFPAPVAAAATAAPAGSQVLAEFIHNVTQWCEYLAGIVAVATVAYGGLRHTLAHTPRAQAEAWRIVLAGLGGLVIALLAPTIVAIVQGLIPT